MPDHGMWATPDYLTDACIRVLAEIGFFTGAEAIMDPCAGDGAWVRALVRAGGTPWKILWSELETCMMKDVSAGMYGRSTGGVDFFDTKAFDSQWNGWLPRPHSFRILGNPPYPQAGGERFVRRSKELAHRFAYILPIGHLEPADLRWLDAPRTGKVGKKLFFPDHFKGLVRVYPVRRVTFRDMKGVHTKTGGRPVALFVWDMAAPQDTDLVMDYGLQRICEGWGHVDTTDPDQGS